MLQLSVILEFTAPRREPTCPLESFVNTAYIFQVSHRRPMVQPSLTEARCGIWLQLGPCCTGVSFGREASCTPPTVWAMISQTSSLKTVLEIDTHSPNFVTSQFPRFPRWEGRFPLPVVTAWEKRRRIKCGVRRASPSDSGETHLRA